ncbi:MAG TPA: M23 family metallopeptidase [Methanothrix sp.]|nr:M23 family metallopeptidase [Methanothrix sp.]
MRSAETAAEKRLAWPLPGDRSRRIPIHGFPGSFAEDRGDRLHCGVDLYAPAGSEVVSIDDGLVVEVGHFTSPRMIPYWNETFYAIVENEGGLFVKFAEMEAVEVNPDDRISSGDLVGLVGSVLNPEMIDDDAPAYIRDLIERERPSMLHLELYSSRPEPFERYRGGNWFGDGEPKGLLDPTGLLTSIRKELRRDPQTNQRPEENAGSIQQNQPE